MDQVGQIWATVLENLTNSKYDDALNEYMRLSNAVSRIAVDDERKVALELEREGESRLTRALTGEIQRISKESISKARNGNLSSSQDDLSECLRLLRVRIGADLISKSDSGKRTTAECRVPIKQLLVVHLTVQCARKRDELRARLDLKKRTKNTVTSPEDGFLDAIEACAVFTVTACKICFDNEMVLSDRQLIETPPEDCFFSSLIKTLNETGATQVRQMLTWFQEDRRIKTYWFKRADELGGLTLPRALINSQPAPKERITSPPPPSSSRPTTPAEPLRPLDDAESSALDLLLHESSQILSLCENEFSKGLLDDVVLDLVSGMVKLDELWLTHNVTKAVAHAVSIEIEPPVWVNSIAEDTFHVVGTCFARAVNSHSLFASEATANHVAGFIADGFVEILNELLRKDAPSSLKASKSTTSSKASKAVAHINQSDGSTNNRMFSSTSIISPLFIEAINTLASSRSYCESLREEMTAAFAISFHHEHAMAPNLLEEAILKMDSIMEESLRELVKSLQSRRALRVMSEALDPRATPYELNVSSFEREGLMKTSWVKDFVDAQFRSEHNRAVRECLPTLSHGPASELVRMIVKSICDLMEERLMRIRFTALGALQLDKDVRALCEAIVSEFNAIHPSAQGYDPLQTSVSSTHQPSPLLIAPSTDSTRTFDAEVRSQFRRLRHWSFLLKLERASDEKEIDFPAPALTEDEIQQVLKRRVERDFFA